MTFKTFAMATTALTVLAGASWAQSNEAYISQTGTDNTGLIEQSGSNNDAGASSNSMTQLGYNNQLTIDQSGDRNDIGLEGDGIYQENEDESNVNFEIDITQSSDRNTVGSVKQIASGDASSGTRNSATIIQNGSFFGQGFNRVGSVYQERKSSGRNILNVTQSGVADRLETVYQRSNTGGNKANEITVTMNGNGSSFSLGNGHEDTLDGFAGATGAEGSTLRQGWNKSNSRGNKIALDVSGIANDFGVTQDGEDNTVGTLEIGGIDNEVGVVQNGNENEVALARVGGVGNNIGISQSQDFNYANVSVDGDYNRTGLEQDGNSNMATVTITGDRNGQLYSGTNFWGTPTGNQGFLGDAEIVASDNGLQLGKITQVGNSNDVVLTVLGDDNGFGLLQQGDNNKVTGTQDGSDNQVAVAQLSNGNTATFTQVGNGNNLGISQ